MNAGDFIEAFERFFLDIIGTILPGFAMVVGFCYVTGNNFADFSELLFKKESNYEWMFLIGFAYILGHGISSLGFKITSWLEKIYLKLIRDGSKKSDGAGKPGQRDACLLNFVLPESELSKKLSTDPLYRAFLQLLFQKIPTLRADADKVSVRTWRSFALSIAQEHSHLVYRFAFISLLNLGVATVLISLFAFWGGSLLLRSFGIAVSVIDFNIWLIAFAIAPYFFLERFYNFNRRAFQVPFSMALNKLALAESSRKSVDEDNVVLTLNRSTQRAKVYLAGGFRSAWHDVVMKAVPGFDYFDPRSHGLANKTEYTVWDLEAVKRCDIVFAYLEAANPGGYALALEVGYAKALGKIVIFVDEKSAADAQAGRYLEMVAETSDISCRTLADGINILEKFQKLS